MEQRYQRCQRFCHLLSLALHQVVATVFHRSSGQCDCHAGTRQHLAVLRRAAAEDGAFIQQLLQRLFVAQPVALSALVWLWGQACLREVLVFRNACVLFRLFVATFHWLLLVVFSHGLCEQGCAGDAGAKRGNGRGSKRICASIPSSTKVAVSNPDPAHRTNLLAIQLYTHIYTHRKTKVERRKW